MIDSGRELPTFKERMLQRASETQFDVEQDDFANLEIREADGFHYFYDRERKRLIKNFVLRTGPRVDTMCNVILITKEGEGFTPRLRIWKKDKTAGGTTVATHEVTGDARAIVKASVDLSDAQKSYWRLMDFLRSFKGLDLPPNAFRVSDSTDVVLLAALEGHDKPSILSAVALHLEGDITEQDVQMLVDRRKALETFQRLLEDAGFVAAEMERLGKNRLEDLWQQFFEHNQWIFGYGLQLVACEAYSDQKLEQRTTGANVFSGGGKRIDSVMRTRGFIQSLMFTEIKRPDTNLLVSDPYRPPDVYGPHKELSGAVAQVQKTSHKAIKKLEDLHRQHNAEGRFDFEISTIRPRQVVVIGHLSQLADEDTLNVERMTSFELYRRDHQDVEIVTFDELLARTNFIVESQEARLDQP